MKSRKRLAEPGRVKNIRKPENVRHTLLSNAHCLTLGSNWCRHDENGNSGEDNDIVGEHPAFPQSLAFGGGYNKTACSALRKKAFAMNGRMLGNKISITN